MGNICSCDDTQASQLNDFSDKSKDPRISELNQHLRIMEQKLISNLSSIEDFKLLLTETKKEPVRDPFKDILSMIEAIEQGFEESKNTLRNVQGKRNYLRKTLENTEHQMNLLSKKKTQATGSLMADNPIGLTTTSNNMGAMKRPEIESGSQDHRDTIGTRDSDLYLNENEEQIAEVHAQINSMYKKISDMLKLLRQGEEEAQVQMLKWENFVIQHEKMQKLREDIQDSFKLIEIKLESVQEKLVQVKELQEFFNKITSIVEKYQKESMLGLSKSMTLVQNSSSLDQQQSPVDTLSSVSSQQVISSRLTRKDSLKSEDGITNGDFMESVLDYDEGESILDTSDMVKDQIQTFTQQMPILESNLRSKQQKMSQFQTSLEKIVTTDQSTDIYELDSFLKQLHDFLNNLEINLRKLNQIHNQLHQKKQNIQLLDYCENLFNQTNEVQLSSHRVQRLMSYWTKLQDNLKATIEQNTQSQTGQSSSSTFFSEICDKELARLQQLSNSTQQCVEELTLLQIEQVDYDDLYQTDKLMQGLFKADQKCRDTANQVIESTQIYEKVKVLSGSLGQQISVDTIAQNNKLVLQKISRSINDSVNRLQNQVHDAQKSQQDSRLDDSNIFEGVGLSTQKLLSQYKQLKELLNETQTQLVAWQQSGSSLQISVLENVDEEDQDQHIIELINIQTQIVKVVLIMEKLDIKINKVQRAIQKSQLNLQISQLSHQQNGVDSQLDTAKQLSQKVSEKINNALIQLKMRVESFKRNNSSGKNASSQEEYQIDSLKNYENQVTKIVEQLETYSIESKDLKDQLADIQLQMQQKIQKSVPQYFTTFHFSIVERDPNVATQVSSSEQFDQNLIIQSYFDQINKQQVNIRNQAQKVKEIQMSLQQILGFVQRQTRLSGVITDLKQQQQQSHQSPMNGPSFLNSSQNQSLNKSSVMLDQSVDAGLDRSKASATGSRQGNEMLDASNQSLSNIQVGNCHFFDVQSQLSTSTIGGNFEFDDIDQAIVQCLEDQTSLKNLKIEKVNKGEYKVEQKLYKFRLLNGNNLAIRMFAGYIYADCLVHFDEELMSIVKK